MRKKPIPNHKGIPVIDFFMKELRHYLPEGTYKKTVSPLAQQKVLDELKIKIDRGHFSFIIDGVSAKVIFTAGIQKWLGYSDNNFSIKKWLDIVHPSHVIPHWLYGSCLWDMMAADKELVTFRNISVRFNAGLKHAKGHYLFCSCDSFIFQISEGKKALEYGYEYTILKDLENEHFSFTFFDENGIRPDLQERLEKAKKEKFKSVGLFTPNEMEVLTLYASSMAANAKDIARQLGNKSIHTVYTQHTSILQKAETFFHHRFDNTQQFVIYLIRLQLL